MKWGSRLSIMLCALALPLSSVAATYGSLALINGNLIHHDTLGVGAVVYESTTGYRTIDPSIFAITNGGKLTYDFDAVAYCVTFDLSVAVTSGSLATSFKNLGKTITFNFSIKEPAGIDLTSSYLYLSTIDEDANLSYCRVFMPYASSLSSDKCSVSGSYYLVDSLNGVSQDSDSIDSLVQYANPSSFDNQFEFACHFIIPHSNGVDLRDAMFSLNARINQ